MGEESKHDKTEFGERYSSNLHKICLANALSAPVEANAEITEKSCCDNIPLTLEKVSRSVGAWKVHRNRSSTDEM